MFKKLLAFVLAFIAASVFAASVDANKANQAELEAVKGIGPAIATKILDERKKSDFKDWPDLIERVKGIGDAKAAKLSTEGLTVNGAAFKGAPVAAKKSDVKTVASKSEAASAPKAEKAAPMAAADKPASSAKADKAASKAEKAAAKKAMKAEKASDAASKPAAKK